MLAARGPNPVLTATGPGDSPPGRATDREGPVSEVDDGVEYV
jgi:hypothetical protein